MTRTLMIFFLLLFNLCNGLITEDIQVLGPDKNIYNLNGFFSHSTLSEEIEKQIKSGLIKTVKSIMKKSRIDPDKLFLISPRDYSFLLLIETLGNSNSHNAHDISLSSVLLEATNNLQEFSGDGNLPVQFDNNFIYKSIKQISHFIQPMSQFIIENIQSLVTQYSVITEAVAKNDLKLLEWLWNINCTFENDGPLAVEKAWEHNYLEVTKFLIEKNALAHANKKSEVCRAMNQEGQNLLHYVIEIGHLTSFDSLLKCAININLGDNNNYFPIHKAIEKHDPKFLISLLENGADLLVTDKFRNTLLHYASKVGNFHAVTYFLENRFNLTRFQINSENAEGKTPLYLAAAGNFTTIMKELIKNGADVSHMNYLGDRLLHLAVKENNIDCIKNLLNYRADPNVLNQEGVPPLYLAVAYDSVEVIEMLMLKWANVNYKDISGNSILHLAASKNSLKVLAELITMRCTFKELDIKNHEGETPIYSAAVNGHLEAIEYLLKNGAYLYVLNARNWTLLHLTIINREELGAISLLQSGFQVNTIALWHYTALHLAVHFSNLSLISILINYGADVNARDHHNKTPIYEATWYGRLEVVKLLYSNRANINARDKDGILPFHNAAKFGYKDIVAFMLDNGIDINSRRNDRKTALYEATVFGHDETVQYLLQKGANPKHKDLNNISPLHKAATYGRDNIMKMLIKGGADVNTIDNHNETPLYYAVSYNRSKCVSILVENGADRNIKSSNTNYGPFELAKYIGNRNIINILYYI